jgi:hypothetical protein
MLFDQVHFRKFVVEAQPLIDTLPAYKPVAWGADWEVVCVPQGDAHSIYEWAKEQLVGRIDISICHEGSALVAFTDPTDAILFKISYQSGVSIS